MCTLQSQLCTAFVATISIAGTSAVHGQSVGSVLWTFDGVDGTDELRVPPVVASNGTIYLPADALYAFNPDGTMQWSAPLTSSIPEVASVDEDNVYVGVDSTILALDRADGAEIWSFTNFGGTLQAGPTVGPDSNIYAIYDNGPGAISLMPDGDLRWELPGFSHSGGSGFGDVAIGADRFYYDDQNTPAPGTLSALVAIDFDGDLLWDIPSGTKEGPRPRVAPNGNVLQQGATAVSATDPQGNPLWTADAGEMTNGPGIGPDNSVYVNLPFEDDIRSYDAQGNIRWTTADVFPLFAAAVTRPTVSPDNEVLVFGTTSGNGGTPLAEIVALDVEDGSMLWSMQLDSGVHVRAAPAFSPDGQVVYVGIENEKGANRLLAIQAQQAEGPVGDINGDGVIGVSDLLELLGAWGPCTPPCEEDLDGDGTVGVSDLLTLLGNWG